MVECYIYDRYTPPELEPDPAANMPESPTSRYLRSSGSHEVLAPVPVPEDLELRLQEAADAAGIPVEEMLRIVIEQGTRILMERHRAGADGNDR